MRFSISVVDVPPAPDRIKVYKATLDIIAFERQDFATL